jgi:flagellar FliJ protein
VSQRFVFRLAPVQRVRRWKEEQSALELRQQIDRWRHARACQDALERAASAARSALGMQSTAGVKASALQLMADGVRDVTGRAQQAAAHTAAQAAAVEERRAILREAARARRTVDRLREIQRSAWQVEAGRAEQKVTDEVASRQKGLA